MPKSRTRAKAQRNAERASQARQSRELPRGVPADVAFCNVTEIDDKLIRDGCNLVVSPNLRLVYLLVGIGIGVAGILGRLFFGISTILVIILLVLGFTFVWQSMHLGMEPARRMMRQFAEAGDETRRHVYFATPDEVGFVLYNGTVRSYPWSAVDEFAGTKDTCRYRQDLQPSAMAFRPFLADGTGLFAWHLPQRPRSVQGAAR